MSRLQTDFEKRHGSSAGRRGGCFSTKNPRGGHRSNGSSGKDYFPRSIATGKTQSLTWDELGRLVGVVQRDNPTNGFNWTAVYDGLGRRLRTTQTPVVNGVANTAVTLTLDSYFDPLVEFEELGVAVNGTRTWKVMGPDLNGRYGGMQGVGGLEATVRESDGTVTPVLDDYFGNVLATIAGTTVNWNPVRVSGYGPVLGYQSPTLTAGTPLAETLLWRSHRIDPSGFYYLGARYYDPLAGHFLSPDPMGHGASMDLYSAFNGDPVNYFDPDGRLGKTVGRDIYTGVAGTMDAAISVGISPLVLLEGSIRGVESEIAGTGKPWYLGFTSASDTIAAGFESYGRAYDVAQHASSFLQIGELFGHQLPIIGNFIPGPQGATSGDIFATFTSRGIYGTSQERVVANDDAAGLGLNLNNQRSAPYVGGTITEVISELLFGNTSRGLEYASQVVDSLSEMGFDSAGMINQIDHSGGVIRGLEGSTYLGFYGIGVANNFSSQGPALGYFNNVQNMSWNLSPSAYCFGEPTSTVSWLLSPGLIGTTPNTQWTGDHIQPGLGSVWDNSANQFFNQ